MSRFNYSHDVVTACAEALKNGMLARELDHPVLADQIDLDLQEAETAVTNWIMDPYEQKALVELIERTRQTCEYLG